MPLTTSVSENIRELKRSKTKRPRKQIIAIAIEGARRAGKKIPRKNNPGKNDTSMRKKLLMKFLSRSK